MYIIQSADMRYEPEHKTRTRDRIVRNSARKLRAEGLSGPDVAGIMKASGLTVGGFYKHFKSKDELLAEAIAQAFSDSEKLYSSVQTMPREDRWKELVRLYLSPDHCDHPDIGCPVAALAPEIARAKLSVRKRVSGVIKQHKWVEFMPGASAAEGSGTSSSFLVRWRVRCPLPASLRSLPTRREYWLAFEIIFCTASDF